MAGARVTLESIENEVNKSPLTSVTEPKSYSGKRDMTIEGYDFTSNVGGKAQCAVTDCQNVTIRRCKFRNKSTLGVALNITGANTKKITVENCIFENLTYRESNGGEPCRLGLSKYSGCNYDSIIRKCIFRNLEADPETVSIKSVGNTIEDCYHIRNNSNFTVRHGGKATIQFNTFEGKGGIRLLGYGNKVLNNLFKDNKETGKRSPLNIYDGDSQKDPNWTNVDTQSGKSGNSHASYAQVVSNVVTGNEFVNCTNRVFYDKSKAYSPEDLKLEGITTVGAGATPISPVEPPSVEMPPQVPPQPETEPPKEPAEEPPNHGRLCMLGHDAEATHRVGIYVCANHVDDVTPYILKALSDIRAAVKSGQIKLDE